MLHHVQHLFKGWEATLLFYCMRYMYVLPGYLQGRGLYLGDSPKGTAGANYAVQFGP